MFCVESTLYSGAKSRKCVKDQRLSGVSLVLPLLFVADYELHPTVKFSANASREKATLSTAAISREKLDSAEEWGCNKYDLMKQDH